MSVPSPLLGGYDEPEILPHQIALNCPNADDVRYDDEFHDDAGNNILDGNAGNDTFMLGDGGLDSVLGGPGTDTAEFSGFGSAIFVDLAYTATENEVWTRDTTNTFNGTWREIASLENIESLRGTAYDDRLLGDGGANTIEAGAGADIVSGQVGSDTLIGGAGEDTFLYRELTESTVKATDTIRDFATGDRIEVSAIDAVVGTATDDAFTFIGDTAFSGTEGQLRVLNTVGSTWSVELDVDGDSLADFSLSVTTTDSHALAESDFVL